MELILARCVHAILLDEAAAAFPREACGLLLGQGSMIERAATCANVAADPTRHFEIEPQALIDALRAERNGGPAVLGYWHSHPTGRPIPSATDQENAARDGRVWAIVAGGEVRLYRDDPEGFHPLPYRIE